MCTVMFCRIAFSNTLDGVEIGTIDLYEDGFVDGLLYFRIETKLTRFHLLLMSEKLKMSVRALMVCGPKYFRCKFELPSESAEEGFFKTT